MISLNVEPGLQQLNQCPMYAASTNYHSMLNKAGVNYLTPTLNLVCKQIVH